MEHEAERVPANPSILNGREEGGREGGGGSEGKWVGGQMDEKMDD